MPVALTDSRAPVFSFGTLTDPETWVSSMPVHEGSWWPAWEHWLAVRSGDMVPPPALGKALCDAPGSYVLEK